MNLKRCCDDETKKMKKSEIVKRNIGLTFDFLRYAIAQPDILDMIPEGSEIDFVETEQAQSYDLDMPREQDKPVLFKVEHSYRAISI
jgi:hypothetical protein